MITWVSERSGIASTLVFLSECQPRRTATAVKRNTKNRLCAENSMTRLIIVPPSFFSEFFPSKERPTALPHKPLGVLTFREGVGARLAAIEDAPIRVLRLVYQTPSMRVAHRDFAAFHKERTFR